MANSRLYILAIYEPKLDFLKAFELGVKFFNIIKIVPNDIGYKIPVPINSNKSGVKTVRDLNKLEDSIKENKIEYFCISYTEKNNPYVSTTFYFGYNENSPNFYRIIISCEVDSISENVFPDFIQFLIKYGMLIQGTYGFSTVLETVRNPYSYVDASTFFLPNFLYEDQKLWEKEVPHYSNQVTPLRQYTKGMMRLVYEINILTTKHLAMIISGKSLKSWIEEDASRGKLHDIGSDIWFWKVPSQSLITINEECYNANLLIAWCQPKKMKGIERPR